jgi:hypothetical protein
MLFAQHVEAEGRRMFVEICARDPKGIGAKLKLGIYKDDGNGRLKIRIVGIHRWKGGTSC